MTSRQAILLALNGQMKRAELLEVLGIVGTEGNYRYKRKDKEFSPPSLNDVVDFFKSKGYNELGAKKAHEYYTLGEWKDSRGKKVINWKQKVSANWFRDEYKIKSIYKSLNLD
jgi:hypothetical protein